MAFIKEVREITKQMKDGKCCLISAHREKPQVLWGFKFNDRRLLLFAEVRERDTSNVVLEALVVVFKILLNKLQQEDINVMGVEARQVEDEKAGANICAY